MTLPRRRLWFVLLAGVVLAGSVWIWAASRATWAQNAELITNGMTREQVIAILGRSPDRVRPAGPGKMHCEFWDAIDGHIHVVYDDNGQVCVQVHYVYGVFACQVERILAKFR